MDQNNYYFFLSDDKRKGGKNTVNYDRVKINSEDEDSFNTYKYYDENEEMLKDIRG